VNEASARGAKESPENGNALKRKKQPSGCYKVSKKSSARAQISRLRLTGNPLGGKREPEDKGKRKDRTAKYKIKSLERGGWGNFTGGALLWLSLKNPGDRSGRPRKKRGRKEILPLQQTKEEREQRY